MANRKNVVALKTVILPASWRQYLLDSDPSGVSQEVIDACEQWFSSAGVSSAIACDVDPFPGVFDGTVQSCLLYTFKAP